MPGMHLKVVCNSMLASQWGVCHDIRKYPFCWLHGVTVIVGLSVSLLLFEADKGHSSGIVFLPAVVIVWLVMHLFLLFVQWLAFQGKENRHEQDAKADTWPLSLFARCGVVQHWLFAVFRGDCRPISLFQPLAGYCRIMV